MLEKRYCIVRKMFPENDKQYINFVHDELSLSSRNFRSRGKKLHASHVITKTLHCNNFFNT